jgi:hypothetical protein
MFKVADCRERNERRRTGRQRTAQGVEYKRGQNGNGFKRKNIDLKTATLQHNNENVYYARRQKAYGIH